ncbi:uncharacterized protein A4U43_C04F1110 [Asparagus officinalis]|uniref:Uncharacterized protein n=1 Tax=Asparagus officinalis TaxID=4686 RepID=A0A5P1F018_ASPOF|nr:uncharacterized protein A4U43_C04F1110 [Asparagus officinalis]
MASGFSFGAPSGSSSSTSAASTSAASTQSQAAGFSFSQTPLFVIPQQHVSSPSPSPLFSYVMRRLFLLASKPLSRVRSELIPAGLSFGSAALLPLSSSLSSPHIIVNRQTLAPSPSPFFSFPVVLLHPPRAHAAAAAAAAASPSSSPSFTSAFRSSPLFYFLLRRFNP